MNFVKITVIRPKHTVTLFAIQMVLGVLLKMHNTYLCICAAGDGVEKQQFNNLGVTPH